MLLLGPGSPYNSYSNGLTPNQNHSDGQRNLQANGQHHQQPHGQSVTSPLIPAKTRVFDYLNDQMDTIRSKKCLKLNSLKSNLPNIPLNEVIEYVYQFVHSYDPPLEIERITLSNNQLDDLPLNFKLLTQTLRFLDLHYNNLLEVPPDIYELINLEVLDLSNNKISHLSRSKLPNLSNLKLISLKGNKFKYLPPVLGEMTNLELIEASENPLIIPSPDLINKLQKQLSDLDWVKQLKTYLVTNALMIESKIYENNSNMAYSSNSSTNGAASSVPHQYSSSHSYARSQVHPLSHSHSLSQSSLNPSHSKNSSISTSLSNSSTPQISRSKSISETKTKASKAARRMGLIIKKPDETLDQAQDPENTLGAGSNNSYLSSGNTSNDFPSPLNFPTSSSSMDSSFNLISPPATAIGTTTIRTTSSSNNPDSRSSLSPPITPTLGPARSNSNSNSNPVTGSNAISGPVTNPPSRSRSNTLIEIDRMLENNDNVDTEHKLGAYFRRLSTLTENPMDETLNSKTASNGDNKPSRDLVDQVQFHNQHPALTNPNTNSNPDSNTSSRNGSFSNTRHALSNSFSEADESEGSNSSHQRSSSTIKTPPVSKPGGGGPLDASPSKSSKKTGNSGSTNVINSATNNSNIEDSTLIIGVSRKILFSFSELHSSVRRFSGFCIDKKVTIKMVSLLYTAKANIDSLVENLEMMEDNSNSSDKIVESLHTCISCFKSIMSLLSENFASFVAKIDVCFIRMLYLTIYGSFNEIFNAYRLLVPNVPIKSPSNIESKSKQNPSLSINTSAGFENNEEVDGKLYDSIEIATAKAQDVFSELTKAISKSAIASANANAKNNKNKDEVNGGNNNDKPDEHNPNVISPQVATKVKELTNVCVSSMDIIKRLKTKLITIRNNPSFTTKKLFWDDINYFLKAIIQTFSSVKGIMKDLPILNDIRSAMATLTKSTKDVTILLEASSYKTMSSEFSNPALASNHPPGLTSIPSVSNIFTPLSGHPNSTSYTNLPQSQYQYQSQSLPQSQVNSNANSQSQLNLTQLQSLQPPVRTPLVATLGPAAQAILPQNPDYNNASNSNNQQFQQPFPHSTHMTSSPLASPGNTFGSRPGTPQSSGQYYANNGMNPFDGLIMANKALSKGPDDANR